MTVNLDGYTREAYLEPTEAQIRKNILGIPKAFIDRNRDRIRWWLGFDVVFGDQTFSNKRLDRENRLGGIKLRGNIAVGQKLRLEIVDSGTLVLHKFGD